MAPTFFREYQLLCEASIFPDGGARKYLRFGGYESFHNAALKRVVWEVLRFSGWGFRFCFAISGAPNWVHVEEFKSKLPQEGNHIIYYRSLLW